MRHFLALSLLFTASFSFSEQVQVLDPRFFGPSYYSWQPPTTMKVFDDDFFKTAPSPLTSRHPLAPEKASSSALRKGKPLFEQMPKSKQSTF